MPDLTELTRQSTSPRTSPFAPLTSRAFSLIEILIAMGLLVFIILGLMLMFEQVQKAFRSSMTQTDVMEAGRIVADTLARELEEMTPTQLSNNTNSAINFDAELENSLYGHYNFDEPLRQYMPGTTAANGSGPWRTNYVERFFFVSKVNQDFVGTGYLLVPDFTNAVTDAAIGSLYRYSVTTNKNWAMPVAADFLNAGGASGPVTALHRVADGITHLRLRAFDTNGVLITNGVSVSRTTNIVAVLGEFDAVSSYAADQVRYRFYSNAVPAYVELEIAFLEPHLLDRYKAIEEADFAAGQTALPNARAYLSNHVANVHLFRRRVPIHNVDFAAYQ